MVYCYVSRAINWQSGEDMAAETWGGWSHCILQSRNRGRWRLALRWTLAFSFCLQSGSPVHRLVHHTFRLWLLTFIKPLWKPFTETSRGVILGGSKSGGPWRVTIMSPCAPSSLANSQLPLKAPLRCSACLLTFAPSAEKQRKYSLPLPPARHSSHCAVMVYLHLRRAKLLETEWHRVFPMPTSLSPESMSNI